MDFKKLLPGAMGAAAGDLATSYLTFVPDLAGIPTKRLAATALGVYAGDKLNGGADLSIKAVAVKTVLAYFAADISEMAWTKLAAAVPTQAPMMLKATRIVRWAGAGYAASHFGHQAGAVVGVPVPAA